MTTAGRRYTKPWRVTWYTRDPATGKPVGGGRRAFALHGNARKLADYQQALGYTVECWHQDNLPGVG